MDVGYEKIGKWVTGRVCLVSCQTVAKTSRKYGRSAKLWIEMPTVFQHEEYIKH